MRGSEGAGGAMQNVQKRTDPEGPVAGPLTGVEEEGPAQAIARQRPLSTWFPRAWLGLNERRVWGEVLEP